MATHRHFTQEYKDHTVSLHLDSGRSIAEVARSIGIHEMTLGKWVKKTRESVWVPDKDLSETERSELERLRKDIAVLRMELDFRTFPGESGAIDSGLGFSRGWVPGSSPELQPYHFDHGFLFAGKVGVRLSRRGRRVPRSGRLSFHDRRGCVVVVRSVRGVL